MSKIIVDAVFKGRDGSCGYKNGEKYSLEVRHPISGGWYIGYIIIEKHPHGGGYCEYESAISFMQNWDNIRHIKQ